MPAVVIDRSRMVPALCSQRSMYRSLLALLKYGQLSHFIRTAPEELENLPAGATVGGPSIESLIEKAQAEKTALEQHLGYAPDDWHLVTSGLLQNDYLDALRRNAAPQFGLDLPPEEMAALVGKALRTASLVVPRDTLLPLGHYEAAESRSDQICIHTAVRGQANFILTGKKALIGRTFVDPETQTRVRAVNWESLVDEINTSSFDLATVAPGIW